MINYSEDAQGPQDPDKLPKSLSFFFFFPLETTAKGIKTLRQVQDRQMAPIYMGSVIMSRTFFA